jgi:hypothetical protein
MSPAPSAFNRLRRWGCNRKFKPLMLKKLGRGVSGRREAQKATASWVFDPPMQQIILHTNEGIAR